MDADLDTLCTVVYCTADDLLPEARKNARQRLTDAEAVTLCVAQAIMGISSDRRFLAAARTRLPEYPLEIAEGMAHVEGVARALSTFGQEARNTISEVDELDDADTADLFTEISRGTDQWLWFVEAHSQAVK